MGWGWDGDGMSATRDGMVATENGMGMGWDECYWRWDGMVGVRGVMRILYSGKKSVVRTVGLRDRVGADQQGCGRIERQGGC